MTACLARPTAGLFPAAGRLMVQPLGAMVSSLGVVLFFSLGLGPFFLAGELFGDGKDQPVHIMGCIVCGGGRAVILSRQHDGRGVDPFRRQIALHDLQGDRQLRVLIPPELEPSLMAVSPDEKELVAGTYAGLLYAVDLPPSGESPPPAIRRLARHPEEMTDVRYAAGGQMLVTRGCNCICAWDRVSLSLRWRRDDLAVNCWDFHPDGRSMVCGTGSGEFLEIDLDTGRTVRRIVHGAKALCAVSVSPCGRLLATSAQGSLTLRDWATGRVVWPVERTAPVVVAPTRLVVFSPCSRYLITTHDRDFATLVVWHVETGRRLGELRGHEAVAVGAVFHGEGKVHSWASDGTVRAWQLPEESALQAAAPIGRKWPSLVAVNIREASRRGERHE